MELCNEVVKHKVFGRGQITEFENNYVTVLFDESKSEKKFTYPAAFGAFLELENKSFQEQIEEEKNAIAQKEAETKIINEECAKLAIAIKAKENVAAKRLKSSTAKISDKRNVAFKCNFCNGGKTSASYGFNGVCSEAVIENNIKKAKYDLCSQADCGCNLYYKNKISYEELNEIYKKEGSLCYESSMLNQWKASAGYNNKGVKAGEARTIKDAEIGSLAILTLVTPNDEERNRRIFAVFLIDEYYEGGVDADGNPKEGFVACNSKYKLNFTIKETNNLMFWNYCSNETTDGCRWGNGLFRYFDNNQAAQILQQAISEKNGTDDETLAIEFFEHYCKIHGIDSSKLQPPSGSKLK